MFRSLRHRNARIFFAGLMLSNIGSWLQFTATSVLLYRLTGRATVTGVNAAFQFLPMLLIGPWAGGLSDRVNRRKLAMLTQAALAAQALVLGAVELAGHTTVGAVYVLSLVLGIVNAVDNPARRGFVTELVPPDDIGNAISLNTAVMTGSRVFGPALAALLIGPLGPGWLFVANGISFAAILMSLFAIRTDELHTIPRAPRGGKPVREAFAYVRNDADLRLTFIVFTLVSTFAFNYSVVLPKLSDVRWASPDAYGWLLAVVSIGSLVGSLSTARLHRVSVVWFFANVATVGVSSLALAWAPNLATAFVVCLPLGAGGTAVVASMNAITQQKSPPQMRSRMLALVAVAFLGSTPIGGPITGWVGDSVSIEWSLGYGGAITLGCLVLYWRARRMNQTALVEATA